jgi:hypothetical protein
MHVAPEVLVMPYTRYVTHHVLCFATGLDNTHNLNRNNFVVGGLPYATVSLGPLLFALPLEKAGSQWQYALALQQTPTLKRRSMPRHWDWPLQVGGPERFSVKNSFLVANAVFCWAMN